LSQFKGHSFEEVANGVKNLNQKLLKEDQVKSLSQFIPSKDDLHNIEVYIHEGGEVSKLPPAEQFALELSKISNLQLRVSGFMFKVTFEPRKAEIKPDLETLKLASKELMDSKRLSILLEGILELGNFINEGTPRGGYMGFKISSLHKMVDAKTTDNTTTLLQYLVAILEKSKPELLKFGEELPHCEAASKLSLPQISSDLAGLQKDFNSTEKSLESFPDPEPFVDILKSFLNKARDDLGSISTAFKVTEEIYSSVAKFFGEDPKSMAPEEFFGGIFKFIVALDDAVKQNEMAIVNEEKSKRRDEAKQKRQQELDKKKGAPGAPDVVDELFGVLKGGNFFKNKRQQQQQQN